LYIRLRPHIEWDYLKYHIRGTVRRFLSLKVGENLNPAFMFSTGQMKTAGLAFLLAVCLGQSLSRMKTIMLDDPVQHIDDFRALHLVELLSAIRRSGRQIICSVEDPALADLLCRRLYSKDDEIGSLITLKYTVGEGVDLSEKKEISPLPKRVLLSA